MATSVITREPLQPHNYDYDGVNLKQVFGTAAAFAAAIRAGVFSKIHNGDYWPLTLSGTVHDYATNTDKTLSNAVFNLEVNINPYLYYGNSGTLASGSPHVLLVSRDCLPWTSPFRSANATWYTTDTDNPWLGSHLYQTLNNETNGLVKLLKSSELGAYVYTGPDGKGMRHMMEKKASGATKATSWGWVDRGILFLHHEKEVWGNATWSDTGYGIGSSGGAMQWPIFVGSRRHISKGIGNGGSRYNWWCECSCEGSASDICSVSGNGTFPNNPSAGNVYICALLCFLIA